MTSLHIALVLKIIICSRKTLSLIIDHCSPGSVSNNGPTETFSGPGLKQVSQTFARISEHAPADAIVASTTSTILSNDLQPLVTHPERFLNAHWLNPAFLVPLVELSPGDRTAPETTERLKTLLEQIPTLKGVRDVTDHTDRSQAYY